MLRYSANVLSGFLKRNNVLVNKESIKNCLDLHPDYPSFLSFSDCLNEWNIPNNSYQINKTDFNLDTLSFPFLTQVKLGKEDLITVTDISKGQVTFINKNNNELAMSEREFLNAWQGVILFAEPIATSGESDYRLKRTMYFLQKVRVPVVLVLISLFIILNIAMSIVTWYFIAIYALLLTGLSLTVLLLMYGINANNPFLGDLCNLGQTTNCSNILNSDSSKVTGWLTWSEVGFFYFAGSTLLLAFVPNSYSFLFFLNISCLPYTVWSISYQYKHKNWCILCCGVQLVLCAKFFTLLSIPQSFLLDFNFENLPIIFLCYAFPIAIWGFFKPFFVSAQQTEIAKKELNKFKFNTDLFNHLISKQPRFSVPDEIKPIILGKEDAPITITLISNPFCTPCADAHKTIEEWFKVRSDIRVKLIFTAGEQDEDPKTKFTKHLISLSIMNTYDASKVLQKWFKLSNKDIDNFIQSTPSVDLDDVDDIIQRQRIWCEMVDVKYTPTVLLNGYKLPKPYTLDDLKYFFP